MRFSKELRIDSNLKFSFLKENELVKKSLNNSLFPPKKDLEGIKMAFLHGSIMFVLVMNLVSSNNTSTITANTTVYFIKR